MDCALIVGVSASPTKEMEMKYTKIVCTIGPASEKYEVLKTLVESGMNVARLNFSHGTYANHKMLMKNIRAVSKDLGRPIAILQDLQGPKIRVGDLSEPVKVQAGEKLVLGKGGMPVQYDLSKIVGEGQRILIDDGLVELQVDEVKSGAIVCTVKVGGIIISHKGINVPESTTDFSVFTPKDKKDLEFGLKNDVDLVAMSFVRTASDIVEVKDFIKKHLDPKKDAPLVIAKIEKPQAIKNLDEIIAVTDGIMVARGDLGIEAAEEMVPVYQKIMIKKCLAAKKPVIVATQMLDSMMRNPRPTRAEVSDIANAVLDHTDATMLSGESAYGKYPLESVSTMARVIKATEQSYFDLVTMKRNFAADPIVYEAVALAKKEKLPIVIYTPIGQTARLISNLRQSIDVYAFSDSESAARKMVLLWGINSFALPKSFSAKSKKFQEDILKDLNEKGILENNSKAVFVTAKLSGKKEVLVSAQVKSF